MVTVTAMDDVLRCPHCGSNSPAFRAMSDAVLAITAELSVERILKEIVHAARRLAHARYAALGVPDGEGGFAQFITSGMSAKQWDAIGTLPRTHGLLGAMLESRKPYRTDDIKSDRRFQGWPDKHPRMKSFLGVPITSKGAIIGAFYLTNRMAAPRFTEADQHVIETLAAHAAIAIENARLYERSRELSVIEERNRLARELHDSVTQTLFSLSLTADAAATLADTDPKRAKKQIRNVQELAREAMQEMRSLIFEFRPAELGADGLVPTLRKRVEVLRRVYRKDIELRVDGERRLDEDTEKELFRIAQEALNNALKHSQASKVWVEIDVRDSRVALSVCDDGVGFDPELAQERSGRLGLTSMRERAEALGANLSIESEAGAGTRVSLEVELDGDDSGPAR